ncbi:HlyD family type I secretion periplasmic adaptor subunit [Vibrio penaeicida]|uniref:Membrane fusion protein (MFP) family protein n=1 Tax=Vibrio penaeicida TaxID=104609 RepID=A0AAV5NV74_9VIBR|nr:HlyD family type I secretion periplasmic adaptor subunit [Vibrio penaeicida]GLQ74249.1 HlyD family type I secretion periplasmic adaptor subunit [Vibrio penaeicida]
MKLFKKNSQVEALHPDFVSVSRNPPSPLGRAVGGLLCFFIVLALVWSSVTRVDKVALATGNVVLQDKPQSVRANRDGLITDVRVKEGELVEEGDVLIVLDNELDTIQLQKAHQMRADTLLEIWQIEATKWQAIELKPSQPPVNEELANHPLLDLAKQKVRNKVANFHIEIDYLQRQINMTGAEINKSEQSLINYESLLNSAKEIESMNLKLIDKHSISRVDYLKSKDRLLNVEKSLLEEKAQLIFLQEKRKSELSAKQRYVDKFSLALSERRIEQFQELQRIDLVIKEANKHKALSQIRAPFSGTVVPGTLPQKSDVILSTDTLLYLTPKDSKVELIAYVQNKDRGHIENGMPVTIKIDGYNYIRYGTITGKVKNIAASTYLNLNNKDIYSYPVLIELDTDSLIHNGKHYPLISGMTVSAEIKVGQRKLVSFFFEPILESVKESFKEY